MWRLGALLAAIVASLVNPIGAAASDAAPIAAQVRLSIQAQTGSSVLVPSQASLTCDGRGHAQASGFLVHVAPRACAFVRRGGVTFVQTVHQRDHLCSETYGGPQRARITGTVGRRPIAVAVDRSDGCGIAEWDLLRPVLGDPGRSGTIPAPRRDPASSTTTTPPTTYRVHRGDTLTDIARQFHTSVQAIVAANQLADPDHLAEGQQLVMPPPGAVRVDAVLARSGIDDQVVRFTLTGADPGELVTFVVTLPAGIPFTGAPHAASTTGEVTADYTAALESGTYHVTATGERGTLANTTFRFVRAERPTRPAAGGP